MFCSSCGADNSDGSNYCRQCGKPLAFVAGGPGVSAPAAPVVLYAGFWMRFLAHLIDQLVLSIPGFFIALFVIIYSVGWAARFEDIEDAEQLSEVLEVLGPFLAMIVVVTVVSICMNWLYHALMESSSWQATVGKRALGIKVTDMDGQRISFMRASGRHFGKILSGLIFSIGYIMAGFTAKKQALHDMLAGTLVVRSY